MSIGATPIARGCGRRKAGAIYGELGLSRDGMPLESFLIDPPISTAEMSNVTPIGVTTMERDGVTHVLDWIGSEHYPNVADFIEEVRVAGLSRRLPSTFDFSKLTPESRILTIHRRALVTNGDEFRTHTPCYCPKQLEAHERGETPCLGVAWEDIEGGDPDLETDGLRIVAGAQVLPDHPLRDRVVRRRMPGFTYTAFKAPDDVRGSYEPAIFGSFPIGRLAVVRDDIGGTHEAALEKARAANVEVAEVEE